MTTFAGEPVVTVANWESRRAPEILDRFRREVFGVRPKEADEPWRVSFEPYGEEKDVFDGKAVFKHIRVIYDGPRGKFTFPLTVYIPKAAAPVPAFVYAAIDSRVEYDSEGAVVRSEYWPVEDIVSRGYATVAFSVIGVAADKNAGFSQGVFPCVQAESARNGSSWATISAWAWAASRAMDWIATESRIDSARVGIAGHSRGGKTALWAGANDKRFAMVCSNDSGCSGAKLNHIALGGTETIARITRNFPYWFCGNYRKYANGEMEMDFDQHELLSLVAPRLLCVASATRDRWAGPLAEWWAAKLASPAWELYGKKGLVGDAQAAPGSAQQEGCVSYHLRIGPHDLTPWDWARYLDFADRHGWRK